MGSTVWFFARTAPGTFTRIPVSHMEPFLRGELGLPGAVDGFLWYVTATVATEGRTALALVGAGFSRAPVDARGFVARSEAEARHAANTELIEVREAERQPGAPVVEATARLSANRYHWKPSKADMEGLRAAITKAAGREIPLHLEEAHRKAR